MPLNIKLLRIQKKIKKIKKFFKDFNMNVFDILKNSVTQYPDREAIVSDNTRLTYNNVSVMVDQFADALLAKGVQKGDRVTVLLRNNYYAVIVYYAIVKIGAIEVSFNVTTESPFSMHYKINDCKPKVLITNSLFAKLIPDSLFQESSFEIFFCIGNPRFFVERSIPYLDVDTFFQREVRQTQPSASGDDPGSIMYTSGTTGHPKGVVLTHANIISGARAMDKMEYEVIDRSLSLIPLYHAYGKMILNSRILSGSTIFLIEKTIFSSEVVKLIEAEKIIGLLGVPTILKMIISAFKEKEPKDFAFFKYIGTGGSKMSEDLFFEIWKYFPWVDIINGYGLTEAGGKISNITFKEVPEQKSKLHSCGTVIPNHELVIVSPDGGNLSKGEIGEIKIKGPNIMQGYWNKLKETEAVLQEGWLYTGDLGFMDNEGDLFIVDRKKDIIKSGGELISPREIEEVINSNVEVEESAVIGISDANMGELIKAFVVLKDKSSLSEVDIIMYCSRNLPPVKIPKIVEFRDSLPKTELKKIMKNVLRQEEKEKDVKF